jgi:hypothetical protein
MTKKKNEPAVDRPDLLVSDQLKDQFVAWFVLVMSGYYLLDYLKKTRKR